MVLGPLGKIVAAGAGLIAVTAIAWAVLLVTARPGGDPARAARSLRAALVLYGWTRLVTGLVAAATLIVAAYAAMARGFDALPQIEVMLVLGAAITYSMMRASRLERDGLAPGLDIDLERHPRFDRLLREVAGALDDQPIETVHLTPGAELDVLVDHPRRPAARRLVLGAALLRDLTEGQLRARLVEVLAPCPAAGGPGAWIATWLSIADEAHEAAVGALPWWPWRPAPLLLSFFRRAAARFTAEARATLERHAAARADALSDDAAAARRAHTTSETAFAERFARAAKGPWPEDLYAGDHPHDLETGCAALFDDPRDLEERAARRARAVAAERPPTNLQ